MKITFLGSGSAFVLGEENYHSNVIVEDSGNKMLIDAGTTIPDALNAQGLTPMDIDKIFITHNHADHSGGLEYIGFKTYFNEFPFGQNRPELYVVDGVAQDLWHQNLAGGMKYLVSGPADISTYFDAQLMDMNDHFYLSENVMCCPMMTHHVESEEYMMPSYGLLLGLDVEGVETSVFFSGDMKFMEEMMLKHYDGFDVIFQDCELAEYPNGVHAQYHQLVTLPEHIKKKMWLYHYTTNNGTIELPDAKADGFAGFVKRGDTFGF